MIDLNEADNLFDDLQTWREMRSREISGMLEEFVKTTDKYRRLISRVVVVLGESNPKSEQDIAVRDLVCDAFDFLDYSIRITLEGKPEIAFILLRRAFETISLLSVCAQDSEIADQWHKGKEFKNADIRKYLKRGRFPEDAATMKNFYVESSKFTHPNRDTIDFKFLGDGNSYTLGSIGRPHLVLIVKVCLYLIDFYFWFAPILSIYFFNELVKEYPDFKMDYDDAVKSAQRTTIFLQASFHNLLEEAQAERPPQNVDAEA